jgi:hypothetical protein
LAGYARSLIYQLGLSGADLGWDPVDLVREAFKRTLAGNRHWNMAAVDIVGHLKGAIRSIAWELYEKKIKEQSALNNYFLSQAGQDIEANKEELEFIYHLFEKDPMATRFIDLWREGLSGPEIQIALSLTPKEYYTKLRQMKRKTRAARR